MRADGLTQRLEVGRNFLRLMTAAPNLAYRRAEFLDVAETLDMAAEALKGGAAPLETAPPPRLVVCAANRNAAGQIVVGARHVDERMREQMLAFGGRDAWFRAEQGFIDQRGVWMSRTEAWKVAEAAGQIRRRCGGDTADGGTLFSENLY